MKKLFFLSLCLIALPIYAETILTAEIKSVWDKDHWYEIPQQDTHLYTVEIQTNEIILYNHANKTQSSFKLTYPIQLPTEKSFHLNRVEDIENSIFSFGKFLDPTVGTLTIFESNFDIIIDLFLININYTNNEN